MIFKTQVIRCHIIVLFGACTYSRKTAFLEIIEIAGALILCILQLTSLRLYLSRSACSLIGICVKKAQQYGTLCVRLYGCKYFNHFTFPFYVCCASSDHHKLATLWRYSLILLLLYTERFIAENCMNIVSHHGIAPCSNVVSYN